MALSNINRSSSVKSRFHNLSSILFVLLVGGAFTACGVNSVVVSGNCPTPNINPLPLKIAIYYDQALRDFSYIEYTETGREEYDIKSGESHIDLFNAILPAMFDQVILIDSLEQARGSGVDAVFAPMIEEFQLALP